MLFDQRGNRKYLTPRERRAFMKAALEFAPQTETFCLTLAYTGARISEVLALTPARIDVEDGMIVFETLKRRQRGIFRAVPIPREFAARLQEVHGPFNAKGGRIWSWSRTTGWQRVKDVMQRAHVSETWAKPKALRHAFGVQGLTEAQVPLNMMQKWLGHARIETTAIYANAVGEEERTIAERMWR